MLAAARRVKEARKEKWGQVGEMGKLRIMDRFKHV